MSEDAGRAALANIVRSIPHPELGLPNDVFAFALKIVPMINVDLLTVDDDGRVLLSWRSDEHDEGWHVPGGIIRARETMEHRLAETARLELEGTVSADAAPSAILQTRGPRGTFISLVFRCRLTMTRAEIGVNLATGSRPGQLSWFSELPPMIPVHNVYNDIVRTLNGEGREDLLMRSVDTSSRGA